MYVESAQPRCTSKGRRLGFHLPTNQVGMNPRQLLSVNGYSIMEFIGAYGCCTSGKDSNEDFWKMVCVVPNFSVTW